MTALQRRLPGVRVEVPTPALGEALPRMDIALFVGFTASGPVDLPVAIESVGEFEAVFGGEIVLAHAAAKEDADLGGLLHPCVRGFFSGGGRRCWIVRVAAASAHTTLFPLANLLVARRADAGTPWRFEPALIAARSPGSWADGLVVATRVAAQSLQVRAVREDDGSLLSIDVLGPSALALRIGDVLRFTFHGDVNLHSSIAELDPPFSERDGLLRRRVRLGGVCGLYAQPAGSSSVPVSDLAYFEPTSDGAAQVEHRVTAWGEWVEERLSLHCRLPAGCVPRSGAVLQVGFVNGASAWLQVTNSVLTQTGNLDGSVGVELSGRLWNDDTSERHSDLKDWIADLDECAVQWLRLGLLASEGHDPDFTLDGIGMTAPVDVQSANLAITTLPDDQRFFGPEGENAGSPVSHAFELTRRDTFGRLTRRFPLASLPPAAERLDDQDPFAERRGELMLIPLGDQQEFGPALGPIGIDRPRLERDGLDDFSWRLFAEPLLAEARSDTLADQAEALRSLGSKLHTKPRDRWESGLRALRGMHAAFGSDNAGVVDEPTLLAIPDAVHPGWLAAVDPRPVWTELPAPVTTPVPACDRDFGDCALTPLLAPRFVRGGDPDAEGNFLLQWKEPEPGVRYELQEASEAAFVAATLLYNGSAPGFAVMGKRPGSQFYRVRAVIASRLSAWSPAVEVRVGLTGYKAREWKDWDPDDLVAIHRLMLRSAAGRGDLLAVLGLPRHYRFSDAVAHASALRDPAGVADSSPAPPPIGYDEVRALSHGALYHPWLLTRRVDRVVESPPDGAVCGQLAAGALERGAWAAVANQPLRDVVALSAEVSRDDMQNLLEAQVSVVRSGPHGFVLSTADTLTPEADWRPINVRRLMTLLRRVALRRGATYLFEPNGATLRRTVERGFEAVMDELFRRGAFAGINARAAYRVDVGEDINTPQRNDLGQFRVDLKVAPALPLTFLTVRLARSGERLVARETR